MTGITNPAEEYFKDGLWAWVTDQWKKLVATAGGALHIQFAGQEADVEVTQTAAADLTPGVCGWDGDSWQKLPMLWGYSDTYSQQLYDVTADAGVNVFLGSGVDAGEVWVITNIVAVNDTSACTLINVFKLVGAVEYSLRYARSPLAQAEILWSGHAYLKVDNRIGVRFSGCTAEDDLWMWIQGYKMKIAE